MRRKLILSPVAREELTTILAELQLYSRSFAAKLSADIATKLKVLRAHPLIGRPRPEIGSSLRSVHVKDYIIIYTATNSLVTIARIVHGARDLTQIFSDSP
jgi:toxin ParE1/3/4